MQSICRGHKTISIQQAAFAKQKNYNEMKERVILGLEVIANGTSRDVNELCNNVKQK